jgi:hypothetical protein
MIAYMSERGKSEIWRNNVTGRPEFLEIPDTYRASFDVSLNSGA